ncbi:hypothetical protein JCM6882_006408 [Rhodosporidiobolus microsporus]
MPTHMTLQEAHAELGTSSTASASEVRSAYKKLSLRYHPDKNPSPEATAKFQRIAEAHQRIVDPPKEPAFSSAGFGGGMGGFPASAFGFGMGGGTFFFGGGGGFGYGGGFGRGYYDDEDEDEEDGEWEEDYTDEDDDDEDEDDFDDYARFMFEDVLSGGFGTRSSYRSYRQHTHHRFTDQDQPPETAEERSARMKAEAERIRKAEERRKNEAKWVKEEREKAREAESRAAAARRSQKKAAHAASKSAAWSAAALAAHKRLQVAQLKRSAVFVALRKGDVDAAKRGVYEDDVDAAGGEWLEGGKEALEGLSVEEREALEGEVKKGGGGGNAGAKNGAAKGKKATSAAAAAAKPASSPAPAKDAPVAAPAPPAAKKSGGKKKKGGKGAGAKKDGKEGGGDDDEAFWATLNAEAAKNKAAAPPPPAAASPSAPKSTGGWSKPAAAAANNDDDSDFDDLPPLVDDNGNEAFPADEPLAPKVNAPYSPHEAPPSPAPDAASSPEMSKSKLKRMKKKAAAAKREEDSPAPAEEAKEEKPAPPTSAVPAADKDAQKENLPAGDAALPASGKGKNKKKKKGGAPVAATAATNGSEQPAQADEQPVPSSPEVGQAASSAASPSTAKGKGKGKKKPASQQQQQQQQQPVQFDPKESLLHIAAKLGDAKLVEWLVDHGANPDERDATRATAFHQALFLGHSSVITFFLESSPPPFPAPHGDELAHHPPDAYYPLPHRQHSLLGIALTAAHTKAKGAKKTWEAVKLVLEYSNGHDLKEAWKKVEFEAKKAKTDQEWETFEEIKWSLAGRAKELEFEGFNPPEEYLRRRRPPVRI